MSLMSLKTKLKLQMMLTGTDGIEYASMCQLEAASCQQQRGIGVKRMGSCGESVDSCISIFSSGRF